MPGKPSQYRSSSGGTFDCYLALPETDGKVPAVVLASAVHGVDADVRAIADEFAGHGYIAAAPDLFSRSVPGPLPASDPRAAERSQPRLERIKAGEADMADTLAEIRKLPQHNGRAAAMGFCFGGPYAILGPKRLGYDAGISCHGTRMLDFIQNLDGVTAPVCIIWATRTTPHPPRCSTPTAPCRPVCPTSRCTYSRRTARLHDAVEHQGVFGADARVLDGPGARAARCATRRCAAQGFVTGRVHNQPKVPAAVQAAASSSSFWWPAAVPDAATAARHRR